MKKALLFLTFIFILSACENNKSIQDSPKNETQIAQTFYGEKINGENAIPIEQLKDKMGDKEELECKVSGVVDAVCQKKGCWMELKNNSGENMRVTFKDYGFFVPKDCQGKSAIVEGIAKIEITSVQDLKEYAKDDGKSKEEIDAITEPLKELVFEANGVILQ